jgi:[ribosomal protein S18]-alanine N-acetyltransferase
MPRLFMASQTRREFSEMSVGGLRVRIGVAEDLAGVVALERVVQEAPHWTETEYAGIVAKQDGGVRRCLFVAEVEARVIGFAVGKVIGGGWDCLAELESVVVDAAARRGGVGRVLCEAVMGWCRHQGATAMELEVRAGSLGAIALYSRLGFEAVGRRGAYYQAPVEDALLMRLELVKTK